MTFRGTLSVFLTVLPISGCSGAGGTAAFGSGLSEETRRLLTGISLPENPALPADPSNRFADDARAAALGKKLFFDPRFSGPLLDDANNGTPGTLGVVGEAQKVACASCHVPATSFLDSRSSRAQISLGSGWSHRRAPSLLDVAQRSLLNWDGRRDTAFSQPFTPIEDATEFNSSRLFAAQQLRRLYRAEYEAIFGSMPELSHEPVAPEDAGCLELPTNVVHGFCEKPGQDDPDVTQIVVNLGKSIQAYTRQLTCGRSRFDAWVAGDKAALTPSEQAGAALFVGKAGCVQCHSGPYLSDDYFHNVGLRPDFAFFVVPIPDDGAAEGLAQALQSAPDVATGIAEQAQQLLEATDEVTDSSVPDEIYMMLGIELMGEVADIAEAAGLPVTSADLASAVRMFLGSVIESLGGDPSQIRDAMSKLDPALVGSEAEAQPFGGQ